MEISLDKIKSNKEDFLEKLNSILDGLFNENTDSVVKNIYEILLSFA